MIEDNFKNCPKYNEYNHLSDEHLEILAKKLYEMAKDEAKLELANNVIDFGKEITGKLFFIIGASIIGIAVWMNSHGLLK